MSSTIAVASWRLVAHERRSRSSCSGPLGRDLTPIRTTSLWAQMPDRLRSMPGERSRHFCAVNSSRAGRCGAHMGVGVCPSV